MGLNGAVTAFSVVGSDLYVGGVFDDAGGISEADYIARWDGQSWHAVGAGPNFGIDALWVANGDLYIAGAFRSVGEVPGTNGIARWDGNEWHALGNGLDNNSGFIEAAAVIGDDIFIGGEFTGVGGDSSIKNVARWDGVSWHPVGSGVDVDDSSLLPVRTLALFEGDLIVGGDFTSAGGNPDIQKVARWNGVSWSAMGLLERSSSAEVCTLYVDGDNLYAGGNFVVSGGDDEFGDFIARWTGSAWESVGGGLRDRSVNTEVRAITSKGDALYVGGDFDAEVTASPSKNFAIFGPAISANVDTTTEIAGVTDPADGAVHLLYTDRDKTLLYRRYDPTTSTWQTTVTLATEVGITHPSLTLRPRNRGALRILDRV